MSVRQDFSDIVEFTIPRDGWDKAFATINRERMVGPKEVVKMLIVLAKHIEQLEEKTK